MQAYKSSKFLIEVHDNAGNENFRFSEVIRGETNPKWSDYTYFGFETNQWNKVDVLMQDDLAIISEVSTQNLPLNINPCQK